MPRTGKARGKSAAVDTTTSLSTLSKHNGHNNNNNNNNNSNNNNQSHHHHQQQQPQQQQLLSPSTATLLKIESVIPKMSARDSSKLVRRAYSTLNSAYIRKYNGGRASRILETTDESQLTTNGSVVSSAIHINVDSGLCCIRRTDKDKDRLPDRINLDRKGLTQIPFIENETNLRLLSLQHNLINTFHIPGNDATPPQPPPPPPPPSLTTTSTATTATTPSDLSKPLKKDQLIGTGKQLRSTTHGKRTSQSNIGERCAVTRNFLSNTNYLNSNVTFGGLSVCTKSSTAPSLKSSFLQRSTMLLNANVHQKNFSNLKKSKTIAPTQILSAAAIEKSSNTNGNKVLTSTMATDEHPLPSIVPDGFSLSLKQLVFLDLYDNQIEKVANLSGLSNLTVLLLGKNRIADITGIVSLKNTLRVLDLHGNKITNITAKINRLQELKSLNLAGNLLRQINTADFTGLFNLKELNLKRNRLRKLAGFDDLRSLERLWLCHNDLQRVDDMQCIAKAIYLREVSIESNPVTLAGDCVSFLVSYLPGLVTLSQMHVTDQVRRAAMAWRRNKELSDASYVSLSSDVFSTIRREEVISNARTNWELLRSQPRGFRGRAVPDSDIISNLSETLGTVAGNCGRLPGRRTTQMVRSSSHDNAPKHNNCGDAIDELFKLPPILAPFLDPANATGVSSASSLGPNVDSASSAFSSETEDERKLEPAESTTAVDEDVLPQQPSIRQINKEQHVQFQTLSTDTAKDTTSEPLKALSPLPELITFHDHAIPGDQFSSISDSHAPKDGDKHSIPSATPSETSSQLSVASSERSTKSRSAAPNRRFGGGKVLVRAQTAKNYLAVNGMNGITTISATTTTGTAPCPGLGPVPSAGANSKAIIKPLPERDREQGGDYLIEICGRYLNVYGNGALKYLDKQWNVEKAADVHTVKFSYISFNTIAGSLARIKSRFPAAENFTFRETCLSCLGQINALAEIQGINSLVIEAEGNPICLRPWRPYAIYRLAHWGLKQVNGTDVGDDETRDANLMYAGLSDLVLWSLPDIILQPLLARLRLDETCNASKMSAKEWLIQADQALKSVVGKEALQWKRTASFNEEQAIRQRAQTHFTTMIENTCNAVEKLHTLETMWPNVLHEMVRNTLIDYSQIEVYVKNLMDELH